MREVKGFVAAPPKGLEKLREEVPAHLINTKPKGGVQLQFVGHAAATDILLDADPLWSWEPVAFDADGLPMFDQHGGLWIKLTVCGVTRLGYGDPDAKKGPNAIKESIGDAIRNAAMRFGLALSLWHKGDLHADTPEAGADPLKAKKAEVKAAADKAGVSMARVSERLVELGFSGPADSRLDVMVLDLLVAWIEEQ